MKMKSKNLTASNRALGLTQTVLAGTAMLCLIGAAYAAKTARVFIDSEASVNYNDVKEGDQIELVTFVGGG